MNALSSLFCRIAKTRKKISVLAGKAALAPGRVKQKWCCDSNMTDCCQVLRLRHRNLAIKSKVIPVVLSLRCRELDNLYIVQRGSLPPEAMHHLLLLLSFTTNCLLSLKHTLMLDMHFNSGFIGSCEYSMHTCRFSQYVIKYSVDAKDGQVKLTVHLPSQM